VSTGQIAERLETHRDRRRGRADRRAGAATVNSPAQVTAPARWVNLIVNPSAFANGTTSLTAS
jgi:hypothetical protein